MCTAVTYKTDDFYFGRTLDYEFSFGEQIVITPRNYLFKFRFLPDSIRHYAIIGMAHIESNYPLYYDAINEKGLAIAGLNFVGYADYKKVIDGKDNVAQFELVPYVLGNCATVKEAKVLIGNINITNTSFNNDLPCAQLHWLIADKDEVITVEAVKDGVRVYDNPVGVLTNNPPFNQQLFQLNNYMHISNKSPQNNFSNKLDLKTYSRGMGGLGLPGDLSSQSRFIRASFVKMNSVIVTSAEDSISQFFHILGSVEQQKGCCDVGHEEYEYTIYTSCCNATKGIYYYTTYNNQQITAVNMYNDNIEGRELICYPLVTKSQINYQN